MSSFTQLIKDLYFTYFPKPNGDRTLFRMAQNAQWTRIVEIGIGDVERTARLLQQLQRNEAGRQTHYAGIDLFDARGEDETPLSLKSAHQRLHSSGAAIKLIPGDPFSALAGTANSLSKTDLVLISSSIDLDTMERAWFYLPRMIHPQTSILKQVRAAKALNWTNVTHEDVNELAGDQTTRRAA
jgi:hypothetical protein